LFNENPDNIAFLKPGKTEGMPEKVNIAIEQQDGQNEPGDSVFINLLKSVYAFVHGVPFLERR
jgi:hypothetical protein